LNFQHTYPIVTSIIINSGHQTDILECLASLFRGSYPNNKVIVLDYHLANESLNAIREIYPDVQVVELEKNLGYAGNNNVGIDIALEQGAEWIFILNDDVVLDPGCLTELMAIGENDPEIGVVGPLVYHHDEPNVIQSAGGLLGNYWQSQHLGKNELDHGQYIDPHHVEWISGCAIMVRGKAIELAGMLDQNYFMYWEETEWCIRIRRVGWKVMHVPQAKIWHKGVRRNYQPTPSFTYYGTRNHLLTLSKHKAPLHAKIFTWMQLVRTMVSWSIKPKWLHKREHRDAMWKALVDFLLHRWGPINF